MTIAGVKNDNALVSKMTPTKDTPTKDTDTTTTESSSCVVDDFSEKENLANHQGDEPAVVGNNYGLSDEQLEYIDLEVERCHRAGSIRSTKEAYKHGLIKRAKDGILDISGLDELRADIKGATEMEETNRRAEAFSEIQENQVANLPEDHAAQLIRQVLDKTLKTWPADHNGETFHVDSVSLNHMLETEWPDLYKQIKAERLQQLREAKQQQLVEAMGDRTPYQFCLQVVMEGENGENQHLRELLEIECSEAWGRATRAARIYYMMRGFIDNGSRQFLKRDRIDRNLKELIPLSNELVADLCRRLDSAGIAYTQPWVY